MSAAAEPELTAYRLLETIPALAGVLRDLTRSHVPGELTVKEWRWLFFLAGHQGTDLAGLGEAYAREPGEIEPVMEQLISVGVVQRHPPGEAGSRATFELTAQGERALAQARTTVAERLTDRIAAMGPGTLAAVTEALDILEAVLVDGATGRGGR